VFTARYALSPYIKQTRFVFKGLIEYGKTRYNNTGTVRISFTQTRVRENSVVVEKQQVLHILCVLSSRQSACAVLYCHLWPVCLYHIFAHYLVNGKIFTKTLSNTKCVFWFSLQLLSETFLILRRIKRDDTINVHRSSCEVPVSLVRF
jgi:hypothetical protein